MARAFDVSLPPAEGRAALKEMGFQWDATGNARWFYRRTPHATHRVYWGAAGWQASAQGFYGRFFQAPEAAVLDAELNGWWRS